jgi:ribosomal-protein-alanine N-acetyltransferase
VSEQQRLHERALDVLDDDDACRLATARFVLEPLVQDDVDDLFAHFGDAAVTQHLDIETLSGRSDARDIIDWAMSLRASGQGLRWAVREASGGFVGTCGFHLMTFLRGRRAEIGYDLAPTWWGRGVMDEVMPAALGFAFGPLGLRRVEAMVNPGNDHSRAVLERHGFTREGVLRDYGFWRGRFWDQILYARLADDPPSR